ncbi:MAG TPA: L,D-transpeptidase family protein [Terrimicrobiaceae bacterium]|nr:L,D-transpeptidase family protein [Terrimicrobiaceae bacterium]
MNVDTAAVLLAPQSVVPTSNRPQDSLGVLSSYARLAAAIAAYRQIAALGGWPPVPPGEVLKTGSVGPGVIALRARLSITGDLTVAAERLDQFDADLAVAVRVFQARHGLEEDAVVGRETLRALNVPAGLRLSSMLLNLTRLAKQEAQWGNRYIAVNAADATYRYVEDGIVAAEGPVVVGRSNWQTPEVDGVIDRLEFNPYWLIPPRIAAAEVWPKAHRDPAYLKRNHMQIVNGQIRQDPGADNPLGKVKFLFLNRYSVYLHDTNHPELLASVKRFRSHGCIRVSGALDLARLLLRDDPSWPEARIQDAISQTRSVRVDLKRPIPVHVVYNTAWVDETGRVQFRNDIYDRDNDSETQTTPHMMDLYGD